MVKLDNKGVTLVELVIGTLILAIASLSMLTCFTSAANVLNKATNYKNASSVASSSIELAAPQTSSYDNITVEVANNSALNSDNAKTNVTLKCEIWTKGDSGDFAYSKSFQITDIGGVIMTATETESTNLTYREFLPSNVGSVIGG